MNWLFSWLVAGLVTLPIAFRFGDVTGKPVDLVGSDFLFALLLFIPRRRDLLIPRSVVLWRLSTVRLLAGATILYFVALAAVTYAETSEMARVVSAVKFTKPLCFAILGGYVAGIWSPLALLQKISLGFAVIVIAVLLTAVCTPGFPQIAWGRNLFGYMLYGYPNSAMTMFAIMVPFLLASADSSSTPFRKWTLRGIALLTGLMVVLSLSRSSSITLTSGLIFYLYLTGRLYLPAFSVVFAGAMLIIFSNVFDAVLGLEDVKMWVDRFARRYSQTVGAEDPFSGRGAIWALTMDLWAEKPVFGYAFEPFSNYADYDTPHQQYLEILYKTGAVGAALYGLVLLGSLSGLMHLSKAAVPRTQVWFLLRALIASFCATMIGNLSQPNLTYSITGNFLMFAIGLTMNKHAAAALVVRTTRSPFKPSADLPKRPPPETSRVGGTLKVYEEAPFPRMADSLATSDHSWRDFDDHHRRRAS